MKNTSDQETGQKTQEILGRLKVRGQNNEFIIVDGNTSGYCIQCDEGAEQLLALADTGLKILWVGFHDSVCEVPEHKNIKGLNMEVFSQMSRDGEWTAGNCLPNYKIKELLARPWESCEQNVLLKTALIIEDGQKPRERFAEALRSLGWIVDAPSSEEEARELLRNKRNFELVLLDGKLWNGTHWDDYEIPRYKLILCINSDVEYAYEMSHKFDPQPKFLEMMINVKAS